MNRNKRLQRREEMKKKEEEAVRLLPRSVRWKLHLNLLSHPKLTPKLTESESSTIQNEKDLDSSDTSLNFSETTAEDVPDASDKSYDYLLKVEEANQKKIAQQRTRYENLSRKHYWSCSPLTIIKDTKEATPTDSALTERTNEGKMKKRMSVGDLPLNLESSDLELSGDTCNNRRKSISFMDLNELKASLGTEEYTTRSKHVDDAAADDMINSQKIEKDKVLPWPTETAEEKSDLKKETIDDPLSVLALMEETNAKKQKETELEYKRQKARMQRYASHVQHRENLHEQPPVTITDTGGACAGSRWNDYYSSREVLSVIEKDLNRLPPDHHLCYHCMKQRHDENYVFVKATIEETSTDNPSHVETGGHRGMVSKQSEIHNDDSNPQPSEFSEIFNLMETMNKDEESVKRSREERSNKLSEILFVYAKEHPALGYRQGMHEILSLVCLCLELDIYFDRKKESELNDKIEDESKSSDTDIQFLRSHLRSVLDYNKLMHDAYTIFEAIMAQLSPGYDVVSTKQYKDKAKASCSMEQMGISILEKLRDVAGDNTLYTIMTEVNVPPQLYCTRWVRLMFSREVVGWENVMKLWDVFFHLTTSHGQNRLQPTITLMNVLECTASSMIQLLRNKLLPGSKLDSNDNGEIHHLMEDYDPNESINILMNYPPLKDISPLVRNLYAMIAQEQESKLMKNHRGLRRVGTFVSASSRNISGVFRRNSNDEANGPILHDATMAQVITTSSSNKYEQNLGQRNYDETAHRLPIHENPNGIGNAMHNFSRSIRGAWGHLDNTFQNLINDQPGSPSSRGQSVAALNSNQRNRDHRTVHNRNTTPRSNGTKIHAPSVLSNSESSQVSPTIENKSSDEIKINENQKDALEPTDFGALASKLDSSVATLVDFLNTSVKDATNNPQGSPEQFSVSQNVWDALSDIQAVKKNLHKHANNDKNSTSEF